MIITAEEVLNTDYFIHASKDKNGNIDVLLEYYKCCYWHIYVSEIKGKLIVVAASSDTIGEKWDRSHVVL